MHEVSVLYCLFSPSDEHTLSYHLISLHQMLLHMKKMNESFLCEVV